jgi:hypothetical protein
MNDMLISHPSEITPAWLSGVLSASGALSQGAVAGFELDSGSGSWSSNARLRVRYTPDARGERPERLFLKMVSTQMNGESFDDSEVTYYTRDYVGLAGAPLLRCYDAVYSAAQKCYHLLLEDVSETHTEACQKEPTLEYGLALAEGLAAMHARYWGAERLAQVGAPIHDAAFIQRFVAVAEPGLRHVLPRFEPQLQPHWPQRMRTLFARHPQALIERTADGNGFTLIHGDAGCYNILVPRLGERPVYLIDRQPFSWSLTTWLGVYDLVYIMVLDWDPGPCRRLEVPVLQRYHARLGELGVTGYSWQQLWDDYRLCAAMGVYIAVEYSRDGVKEEAVRYWLPRLQRSLAACDDLDVLSLL